MAPARPRTAGVLPRPREPDLVHRYHQLRVYAPPDMRHGNADNGVTTPRSRFYEQGRFGRIFPTLPPSAADTPTIRQALVEVGQPGGILDAQDDLTDPVTLITDPAKS